jgi:hypothetical protein
MTPEEAYTAGLPGTYMNGGFFPAPVCLYCMATDCREIAEHPGCPHIYFKNAREIPKEV